MLGWLLLKDGKTVRFIVLSDQEYLSRLDPRCAFSAYVKIKLAMPFCIKVIKNKYEMDCL